MTRLDLTLLEQQILERSNKPEITHRRRKIVIVSGLFFATALIAMALVKESWQFVLGISLLYIIITIWEKLAYANAVIEYKSLIVKLKNRLEELEAEQSS